ncbi:MAG: hypothetical protein UH543_04355 [Bacteroidales bacterium]|nr:hypothetical protein [Bacteroidales bacterium]
MNIHVSAIFAHKVSCFHNNRVCIHCKSINIDILFLPNDTSILYSCDVGYS